MAAREKLMTQVQWAKDQRCPLLIDWDTGSADIYVGLPPQQHRVSAEAPHEVLPGLLRAR